MSVPALKGSPLPPAKKPAGLAGQLEANKKPIMIAGAGLVAVLALLHRKQTAAGAATSGTSGTPASFAGQSTSSGPYDSTGTDVYNALQPQIEQTQGMLANLLARLGPAGTVPTTSTPGAAVPTTAPTRAPVIRHHTPNPLPPAAPARIPTPPAPTRAPVVVHRTPPPPPGVRAPVVRHHVVRKGESLSTIAKQYGTSWTSIYAGNRGLIGANPNVIRPGQSLVLPAAKK